jgi:DNA-binding transcriptional MerR regulator
LHVLSDLTRITGGNRRTLQFWAEQGVLRSGRQHEGSGVRREFDDGEVIVACAVNGLSSQGVPIGKLIAAAWGVRSHLVSPIHREMFNDAITGQGVNLLLLATYSAKSDGGPKETSEVSMFSDTRSDSNLEDTIKFLITSDLIGFVCVNLNACLAGVQFQLAQSSSVEGQKAPTFATRWPPSG